MARASVSIGDFIDPEELRKQSARIEKAFSQGRVLRDAMHVAREVIEQKHKFAHGQFAEGDYKTGVDIFRYLVVLDPYDIRHWLGLGACWLGRKNPGKALEACFAAAIVDAEHPAPMLMTALVYLEAGSQKGAEGAISLLKPSSGKWEELAEAGRQLVGGGSMDPEIYRREADSLLERCMRNLGKLPPDLSLDAEDAQEAMIDHILDNAEEELPETAPQEFKQFQTTFLEGFNGNIIQFALQYLQ